MKAGGIMVRLWREYTSNFSFYNVKSNILNKLRSKGNTLHISFKELKDKNLKCWLKHLITLRILQVEREPEIFLKIKKAVGCLSFDGINLPWVEVTLANTRVLIKFPPNWQYRPRFLPMGVQLIRKSNMFHWHGALLLDEGGNSDRG